MTEQAAHILVVDDDARIRSLVSAELQAAGYTTLTASDGEEAWRQWRDGSIDMVVTDLAMPGEDGFDLIARIRGADERNETPIVVLSVRAGDGDKIRALDLGADDYVVKPFSVPELLARVRAQLRRRPPRSRSVLQFGELVLDMERRLVTRGGEELHLTPTELAILELLARNAGRPVTLAAIVRSVWKAAPGTSFDTVRVHVRTLRRKIEPDAAVPRYIVTEPWVGYRFNPKGSNGNA